MYSRPTVYCGVHTMLSRALGPLPCAFNLTLCCFSSRRPVSARARSDGPDASQHVHTLEDAQRQPQPQATVHGERMMAGLQACLSECVSMCTVALLVEG